MTGPTRRSLGAALAGTALAGPALGQGLDTRTVIAQLAPTGTLRAGINLGNFLLVTGKSAEGEPEGVAPDMARAIAQRLGVPLRLVPYERPGALADDAGKDKWDIGLIGAEPQRAEKIAFTPAYCQIEATYLVPPGSPITAMDQVDAAGRRIYSSTGSAFTLWLERNITKARLVLMPGGGDASFRKFVEEKGEVLAGLRPGLIGDAEKLPGSRILDGQFMAVQQAIGTTRANTAGAQWLTGFVEAAKRTGLVARLIEKHKVRGLSVAPAA